MKKTILVAAIQITACLTIACRDDIEAIQLCTPCGNACCSDNELCIDQMCSSANCSDAAACSRDDQCQDGYSCIENCCTAQAVDSCSSHRDCPNGQLCENGICNTPACHSADECPSGYTCIENLCQKEPPSPDCKLNCASDRDCLPSEICDENFDCAPQKNLLCMAFDDSSHYLCRDQYTDNYSEDTDGDGILDAVECHATYTPTGLQSPHSDPCLPDSDGDTLLDGLEDLNQNGQYEPEFGETNPITADSAQFSRSEKAARKAATSAPRNSLLAYSDVSSISYFEPKEDDSSSLAIIGVDDDDDYPNGYNSHAAFLNLPNIKVFAAHGSSCDKHVRWYCMSQFDNAELINQPERIFADKAGQKIVQSHGKVTTETFNMPSEKWNNGVFDAANFMPIPSQEVKAYQFDAELKEGQTLEMYRGHYFNRLQSPNKLYHYYTVIPETQLVIPYYPNPNTSTHCPNNMISVLAVHAKAAMSTAFWKTEGLVDEYTIAVACKSDMQSKTSPTYIAMENLKLATECIPFKELDQTTAASRILTKNILQSGVIKEFKSDGTYKIKLKGLPIASSIRVSLAGCSYHGELHKNANVNGWRYNVEENAIELIGVTPEEEDGVAVNYAVWD